jgi:hypothetical protein
MRPLTAKLILILCLSPALPAQLSGRYTLDPAGSGSRNFKSFPAVIYQLYVYGVNGAVEVEVADGNYGPSNWSFVAVPGASSTNTVTFKSRNRLGAKMITTRTESFKVESGWLAGTAKWLIIDGFEFAASSSSNERLLIVKGVDIEIRNCKFLGYLSMSGPRMKMHHSEFQGMSSGAPQMYFSDAVEIEFHHNRMHTRGQGGLRIQPKYGSQTSIRHRVYNNVISGSSSYELVSAPANTDLMHNTLVRTAGGNSGVVVNIAGALGLGPRIRNNILVNLENERLISTATIANSKLYFTIDYNLYYSKGTFGSPFNAGSTGYSLSKWQTATGQDAGSRFLDPKFRSTSGAFDLRLQPGSPAVGAASGTPVYVVDDYAGSRRAKPASIGAYEGAPTATFNTFGSGCAGTGSYVPKIGYTGSLEWGSANFAITLTNALGGTGVRAMFVVGASQVSIPFGGSCRLLASPDVVFALPVGGASGAGNGSASVSINIPNDPKLKGARAYFQWGVVDPTAAGIGIATSSGATLTL